MSYLDLPGREDMAVPCPYPNLSICGDMAVPISVKLRF